MAHVRAGGNRDVRRAKDSKANAGSEMIHRRDETVTIHPWSNAHGGTLPVVAQTRRRASFSFLAA